MVGDGVYKTKTEAESAVKTTKVCTAEGESGEGAARSAKKCTGLVTDVPVADEEGGQLLRPAITSNRSMKGRIRAG
ncbi:hypothetical protein ACVWZR_000194 [Bradyrhizobium sp. i1.3.1]